MARQSFSERYKAMRNGTISSGKEEEKSSSSVRSFATNAKAGGSFSSRYRMQKLERSIGFDTFEADLASTSDLVNSVYGGWKDTDAMNKSRDTVSSMYDRLNKYKEYVNSTASDQDLTKFNTDMDTLIGAYGKALGDWDALSKEYGSFINADAHGKAKKNYELSQKYAGLDYAGVQRAMAKTPEDASFLSQYGLNVGYGSLADYDAELKAVADKMTKVPYAERKNLEMYYDKLEAERNKYATENRFDKYSGLMQNPDFAEKSQYNKDTDKNFFEKHMQYDLYEEVNEGQNLYKQFVTGEAQPNSVDEIDWKNSIDWDGFKLFAQPDKLVNAARYMNDDERAVFNYIWETQGEDAARSYVADMEIALNKRESDWISGRFQDVTESAGWFGNVTGSVLTVPWNVIGAPIGFVDSTARKLKGEEINPYSGSHVLGNVSDAIRDTTREKLETTFEDAEVLGTNVPAFLYDTTLSIGESALGVGMFGKGASVVMGMGAANSAAKELKEAGASEDQILKGAAISGAAEMLFEKFSIDGLLKTKNADTLGKVVRNTFKQAGVEASEEIFTEITNQVSDYVIRGGASDYMSMVDSYMTMGYAEEEAKKKANLEVAKQIGLAGIGGAISGGVMGGASTGAEYSGYKDLGNLIMKNNQTGTLSDVATELGNADYADYLKRLNEGTAGKAQLGSLYTKVSAETDKRYLDERGNAEMHAIANRANELGDTRSSGVIASAIVKKLSGKSLSAEEKAAIKTDTAKTIMKEIRNGEITAESNEALDKALDRVGKVSSMLTTTKTADSIAVKKRMASMHTGDETIDNATGNKITIEGMRTDDEGNTVLQTSEGERLLDDVTLSDGDAEVVAMAEGMDADKADLFVSLYQSGSDVQSYSDSFELAFSYGKNAYGTNDPLKNKGVLTEAQVASVYELGLRSSTSEQQKTIDEITAKHFADGKEILPGKFDDSSVNYKKLNGRQKAAVSFARMLSEKTGVNIVFFESEADENGHRAAENGRYERDSNTIYVDVYAGMNEDVVEDAVIPTLSHEMTHWMKNKAPEAYAKLSSIVMDTLGADMGASPAVLVGAERARFNMAHNADVSSEYAQDELIARACEDMLTGSARAKEILSQMDEKTARTLAEKVKEFFEKFKEWMADLLGAYKSNSNEAKIIRKYADRMNELQETWDDAFEKSIRANQAMEKASARPERMAASERQYSERNVMYDASGNRVVVIDKMFTKNMVRKNTESVEKTVRGILSTLNGKSVEVRDNGKEIFFDDYFSDEFTGSNDTVSANYVNKAAKMNAATAAEDIVRNAKYDGWKPNKKPNRKVNADRGFDYYNVLFAFENEDGSYSKFGGTLNVRKDKNGKDYAYDITKVNKRGSAALYPNEKFVQGDKPNLNDSVPQKGNNVKLSDRDSNGNGLTPEQVEFFKESKVRDEKGNLLVMYHGTPNAGFTVFRSGTYFTENKEYADVYQNQGASSLGYKKTADNPDTYAVYLNIKKPFDTRNKAERDIFYNEYYRKYGMGTDLMDSGLPDWMDGMDLQEFLEENGYDYDGLILDEGGVGGYGDEVKSRGLSYVVFNANQVKDITNQNPTENEDIRYSTRDIAKLDTDYLKAVQSGDMDAAQKMVDEAAKKAGYTYKGMHATNTKFTVFDINKTSSYNYRGKGIYFTNSIEDLKNNYENYEGPDPWVKVEGRAYELADEKYGLSYEDTLTSEPEIVDKVNECYDEAIEEFKNSLRRVTAYLRFENPLILEKGTDVPEDLSMYDGIIDKQVYETFGHKGMDENTVHYVVLNPRNIKSADTVTYDDAGNVIPLSQRFNAENEDIRYSTRDSEGNGLTKEQTEYFKESKLRDKNGNLKVMYHGTSNASFTVFNPQYSDDGTSLFFTDSKNVAKGYSGTMDEYIPGKKYTVKELTDIINDSFLFVTEEDGKYHIVRNKYGDLIKEYTADTLEEMQNYILEEYGSTGAGNYKVYLNLTNPLIIDAKGQYWDELEGIGDAEGTTRGYAEYAKANGYDGVIIRDVVDTAIYASGSERFESSTVAIAFFSEQVKSVANESPTVDSDIRYSDRDIDSWLDDLDIEDIINDITGYFFEDSGKKARAPRRVDAVNKRLKAIGLSFNGTKSLAWTDERIEKYLSGGWYGSSNPEYAQAYIAYVTPQQFLNLTVGGKNTTLDMIENESKGYGELDIAKLGDSNPLSLYIHEGRNKAEVEGHEGRHRMYLLGKAGFEKVPVLLFDYRTKYDKTAKDSLKLTAQRFNDTDLISKARDVVLSDLIPFSNGNKDLIIKKFGSGAEADVHYSERQTESIYDAVGELKRLQRENEKLRKDVDRLRQRNRLEHTVTGGNILNENQIDAVAGHILNIADSRYSKENFAKELKEIYSYLQSEGVEWDVFMSKATDTAQRLIAEARERKVPNDYSKMILDTLRTTRVSLNDVQKEEAKNAFGSDWNRMYFGRVLVANDGIPLESVWSEWSMMYPDVFDADISDADMATAVLDAYDTLKASSEIIESYDNAETARAIALEIYNQFWNVSPVRTLADKHSKEVKRLKFEHRQEMKELRDRYNVKKDEAVQTTKERYQKTIQRLKEKRAEDIQFYRDKSREYTKQYKEKLDRQAVINKITKKALKLNTWLVKNSKDEHVPEILKKPVAAVLKSLNFSSERLLGMRGGDMSGEPTQRDISLSKAFENLEKVLTSVNAAQVGDEEIEGMYGHLDMPDGFMESVTQTRQEINDILREVGDNEHILNQMTVEQLEEMSKILSTLTHAVRNMNKALATANGESIANLAQDTMLYADGMGQHSKAIGKITDFFNYDNVLPVFAFKRFGEGGQKIFEGIQDGWDKFAFHVKEIIDYTESVYDAKEVREWSNEVHEFDLVVKQGTETVKMTTAQVMALYCLQKREQARGHLIAGGIRVADFKAKKQGKVSQPEGAVLRPSDIDSIISVLTDRQVEVADRLQEFMNDTCTDWGNEVSMKRFGYKAFGEENYFPIRSDANNLPQDDAKEKSNNLFRLLNMSFTKGTIKNANNRVVIESIFDVFASHTSDMAKYNALALPILDAFKWYNYKEKKPLNPMNRDDKRFTTIGVKQSLEKAYGEGVKGYVVQFLRDINGESNAITTTEQMSKKLISNYKVASVGANLRVAILQPTAYVRASVLIDPKYLTKAFTKKPQIQKAKDTCGMALWKSLGFYDININAGVTEMIKHDDSWYDVAKEKSMFLAEKADELTWGFLYNACEAEVSDKNPGLSGDAKDEAVAKRLREVIYSTQVVDSTMTRTQAMRSRSTWSQIITSFMSEPMVSYNLLHEQLMNFMTDKKKYGFNGAMKRNGKHIARVAVTYAITTLCAATMGGLIDTLRDDEDEKDFGEVFIANIKDNALSDVLSMLPLMRDVVSIYKGFGANRLDMQGVTSAVNASKKLVKDISDGNGISYSTAYSVMRALSQTSGLPASNAMRDVIAIWNSTIGEMYESLKLK